MIKATILEIENYYSLNIVKFDFLGQTLTMMSLELSSDIKKGSKVLLQAKPSHVAIGKNTQDVLLSYSNQLESKIVSITKGKLLAQIKLEIAEDAILESIITNNSVNKLDIKEGDKVDLFIKASELSILKVIDD